MSRQPLVRSKTPAGQAEALFPSNISQHNPLPPIKNTRRPSRDQQISPIRVPEPKVSENQQQAEKLRNNQSELIKKKDKQHANYYFAPDQPADSNQNRSQTLLKRFDNKPNFYNGWDQVVKNQAESEKRAMLEQKMEERLRKQRYKENLDQLIQQQQLAGRQGHYSKRRLGALPYDSRAPDFETEYRNAMKPHCNFYKIAQDDSMNKEVPNSQHPDDLNPKVDQQIIIESPEDMQQQKSEATQPNLNGNNRYTQELDSKADELEKEKDYISKLYGIPRHEVQGPQFYDRVRHKSVPPKRSQDGMQLRNQSRDRTINDLIEQNRLEKLKQEEAEQRKIEEQRKQKYKSYLRENEQLMQAKYLENQIKKQAQDRAYEQLKAQIDEGKAVEQMQKQSVKDYKRMYFEYLNWQVAEKQHHKVNHNQLSRVEKLMILRANQEGKEASEFESSPIPNGKNGYERKLQLSYIDRWLKYNPSLPPQSHDRIIRSKHREEIISPEKNKSFDHYKRIY